ncbi:MAG: hypothetical protein SGCHY_004663, partial [Lobulomycetales sp.]
GNADIIGHVVQFSKDFKLYFDLADDFLSFLTSHVDALERGERDFITPIGPEPSICIFPNCGPYYSCASTRGIRVEASSMPCVESSNPAGVWTYRIKMTATPAAPGLVQLVSRFWKITYESGHEETVAGPGAVGMYPILSHDASATADATRSMDYCSNCMGRLVDGDQVDYPACMQGYFTFVLGLAENHGLSSARSEDFHVVVAPFRFQKPTRF